MTIEDQERTYVENVLGPTAKAACPQFETFVTLTNDAFYRVGDVAKAAAASMDAFVESIRKLIDALEREPTPEEVRRWKKEQNRRRYLRRYARGRR